jgi:hypothetical protein
VSALVSALFTPVDTDDGTVGLFWPSCLGHFQIHPISASVTGFWTARR